MSVRITNLGRYVCTKPKEPLALGKMTDRMKRKIRAFMSTQMKRFFVEYNVEAQGVKLWCCVSLVDSDHTCW